MSRQERISELLKTKFKPDLFELENESHTHNVPKGSETHFKLLMVSQLFEGLGRVQRQQMVMSELKFEFETGLHALSMRLLSHSEAQQKNLLSGFESPACKGGQGK